MDGVAHVVEAPVDVEAHRETAVVTVLDAWSSAPIAVGASELEPPGAMSVRFDDLRVYAP